MKIIALIITLLTSVMAYSQGGIIKVRKKVISYDSVYTFEEYTDTTFIKKKTTFLNPKYVAGFGTSNVLFRKYYVYYFNQPIKKKWRKKVSWRSKSRRFWGKIKNKVRRNKLHYFRNKYSLFRLDSIEVEIIKKRKVLTLFDSETKELTSTEVIGILNEKSKLRYINSSYQFISRGDTVNFNSPNTNRTSCESIPCLFQYLADSFKKTENKNKLRRVLTSEKSIYYDHYEIEFDLKNTIENSLTIIKNKKERYKCDYRIRGRNIIIRNSPIAELTKGRINRKKTVIKFKIHRTTHTYVLK